MITQSDIDALRRIKEHCHETNCSQCPLDSTGKEIDCLLVTEPIQWRFGYIKPDATDAELSQTVEIPAIDPITQRQDKLEALLKELAEQLLDLTRKAAETDNRVDEIINIMNSKENS